LLSLILCTAHLSLFLLLIGPPPRSTLFPYTTLFRSIVQPGAKRIGRRVGPCTWNALRGSHGSALASWISFSLSRKSARAIFASRDRKSTRLNSSHVAISYAVFCLKKKKTTTSGKRRC